MTEADLDLSTITKDDVVHALDEHGITTKDELIDAMDEAGLTTEDVKEALIDRIHAS